MAMKVTPHSPKVSVLKPRYQIQFSVIYRIFVCRRGLPVGVFCSLNRLGCQPTSTSYQFWDKKQKQHRSEAGLRSYSRVHGVDINVKDYSFACHMSGRAVKCEVGRGNQMDTLYGIDEMALSKNMTVIYIYLIGGLGFMANQLSLFTEAPDRKWGGAYAKKIRSHLRVANTPNQAETLLHSLERTAAGIGLHVNADKTEYMCFNQTGDISTLDGTSLKLVDKFTYLGSSVSSTEKDIDTRLTKARTAVDKLSIIWKSDLTDKMTRSFFQAAVLSILLYGCTPGTLTKRLEKKLDDNYTRMLRAILNKSWQQHPTRHQLYGHLPPITKTIQARRTSLAGHC